MSGKKETKKVAQKSAKAKVDAKTPYDVHAELYKAFDKARDASRKAEQKFYAAKDAKSRNAALKDYIAKKMDSLEKYRDVMASAVELEKNEIETLHQIQCVLEAAVK